MGYFTSKKGLYLTRFYAIKAYVLHSQRSFYVKTNNFQTIVYAIVALTLFVRDE